MIGGRFEHVCSELRVESPIPTRVQVRTLDCELSTLERALAVTPGLALFPPKLRP